MGKARALADIRIDLKHMGLPHVADQLGDVEIEYLKSAASAITDARADGEAKGLALAMAAICPACAARIPLVDATVTNSNRTVQVHLGGDANDKLVFMSCYAAAIRTLAKDNGNGKITAMGRPEDDENATPATRGEVRAALERGRAEGKATIATAVREEREELLRCARDWRAAGQTLARWIAHIETRSSEDDE